MSVEYADNGDLGTPVARRTRRSSKAVVQEKATPETRTPRKRKKAQVETEGDEANATDKNEVVDRTSVEFLLSDPASPIATVNISDILNPNVWYILSDEAKERLARLLPPTAFSGYKPIVDSSHPSQSIQPPVRELEQVVPKLDELKMTFFSDPHFESAARTFQGHLHSGLLTGIHSNLVETHVASFQAGALHAPWKDDVWTQGRDEATLSQPDIDSITLIDLASAGLLRSGDVLAYSRKFEMQGRTVEVRKDAMVRKIHPKGKSVTIFASPRQATSLPFDLLIPFDDVFPVSGEELREVDIISPHHLESVLLDIDSRVERGNRGPGDPWKRIQLWRFSSSRESDMELDVLLLEERGGRECYGTLSYLRTCL